MRITVTKLLLILGLLSVQSIAQVHDHSNNLNGGQLGTSAVLSGSKTGNGSRFVTASGSLGTGAGDLLCNDGTGNVTTSGCSGGSVLPAGPTSPNGVPSILTSTPSSGVAGSPVYALGGVPVTFQTGTSYTMVATDRASHIVFSNGSAVAVTMPQAGSTGFANNFVVLTCNKGVGAVTFTPTTSTVSYATGSGYITGASTLSITTGQCAFFYSDNSNYTAVKIGGSTATGDVVGPSSAVDSDFAMFDGTTGKLIKDGGISLDTDTTLAANSDSRIASQKAIKAYVNSFAPGGAGALTVKTNGINNSTQSLLNLAGAGGIAVSESGGTVTITGGSNFGSGGDGLDGALTYDGSTTILGMAPSSSIYTLTRDISATNITINSGVSVKTGNYLIKASGTCTINGTLRNNGVKNNTGSAASAQFSGCSDNPGNPAEGSADGHYPGNGSLDTSPPSATCGPNGTTGVGAQAGAGGAGGASARAVQAGGSTGVAGAAGGAGGNGTPNAGGAARSGPNGGTVTNATVRGDTFIAAIDPVYWTYSGGTVSGASFYTPKNGMPGGMVGGSGGGGDGTNPGGGGGGGGARGGQGGYMALICKNIVVGASGVISANGGDGSNGGRGGDMSTANVGGGGGGPGGNGGNGGTIWLIYQTLTNGGTISVAGGVGGTAGAGGNGHGTGTNGSAGTNGNAGLTGALIQLPQ